MKKVLCVKDFHELKAGDVYEAEQSSAEEYMRVFENRIACTMAPKPRDHFKVVETFEHGGEEWIKHDTGVCPVPDDWVVCVMIRDKTEKFTILCNASCRSCWMRLVFCRSTTVPMTSLSLMMGCAAIITSPSDGV